MFLTVTRSIKMFFLLASVDAVWLVLMGPRFYRHYLGYLFADTLQYSWAILFYALYVVAITHFIFDPYTKLPSASVFTLFAEAFFFGLVVYGAYDLTNQATIKNWPLIVTVVDMLWGATLTGLVMVLAQRFIK